MRILLTFVATAVLLVGGARAASAQARTARFYVDSVTDSTIVFRLSGAGWLKPGVVGVAVDPRRRDALIARFRIIAVGEQRATALITGQTTFVTPDHVALVDPPPSRPWRERSFWAGTLLGAVLGAVAAVSF